MLPGARAAWEKLSGQGGGPPGAGQEKGGKKSVTQKELKNLRRADMLKIMLEQQKKIDSLTRELSEANAKLADRRITIDRAGSIAEASLALGSIFEEAQQAADRYLANVREQAEGGAREEESDDEDPDPPSPDPEVELPTTEQLEELVEGERYRRRYFSMIRSTVFTLLTVSAVAVLIAVLLIPVLQIYGSSMNPSLVEGDLVISLKGSRMETGDIVAFYYNNKVLVKRVIGQAGQWIDIDEDGTVYVDDVAIDEPYLQDKAFGECNIQLPYQVPESRVFVMGDNRSVSVDSRSTTVGCVAEEQLVGKIVFCVWPFDRFGAVV